MTPGHLFDGYFDKYQQVSYPKGYCPYGVLLPRCDTHIAIGLDACASLFEAAQFEMCWQILHPLVDFRQAIFVEGATNLNDLVTSSKAHLVPLETAPKSWTFQSALSDLWTCSRILKAVIANREYVAEAHCREVFQVLRFQFPPHSDAPIDEALQALQEQGEIWTFGGRGTLYYTAFPHVFQKFRPYV